MKGLDTIDYIDLNTKNYKKISDWESKTETNIEVILLGEEKVGKTQIINQLIDKTFDENYIKTLSTKSKYKTIKILEEIIKPKYLTIYDLPGAKQFRSINNTFLKSSNIILLIYDITNFESFIELYNWNELLNEKKNILKCVIGNKNDLLEKREISQEDGKNFADKIEALFFETNAKDYIKIDDIFTKIVSEYSLFYEKKNEKEHSIHLRKNKKYEDEPKERKGCGGCFGGNDFVDFDYDAKLFTLKVKNSKKNINEDNNKNEKKTLKEIIKYKNGDIKEIYNNNIENEDEEYCIFKFQNGDIFKGKVDKDNNILISGLLNHKNTEINIYNKKIINLITILIITNNKKKLNQDDSNEKFFELDNNFVIKVNFKDENIIIDENILENVNVILFIFDEINVNYIAKIKSFHDKIIKIKKKTITIGIIAFKNSIKKKEISKSIKELSKSLNIFFEEVEEIEEDFFSKIKNKYLNNYENKVIENENGYYFGECINGKKEGYGIMFGKDGSMYFGEWENDLMKGNGIFYNNEGYIYKGEWENNEFTSGGMMDFFGVVNEGKFLNGEMYEGKIYYFDFMEYEGTFKNECLYGKAEIKNGNIYEGKWENIAGIYNGNGEGIINYTNNDIYRGKWNNFKKHGKGIIYTEDGDIFESEWENDIIKGNWMLKSKNGDIFIGEMNIDEENENEENIEIKFEIDDEKYNLEEKINIIEKYLLGFQNLENFEIYDDEIIKVEYDIQYIYKIWKIGQNISKYINEGKMLLFFKEFFKSSFNSNKNCKTIIINKIERLIKILIMQKNMRFYIIKQIFVMIFKIQKLLKKIFYFSMKYVFLKEL